MATNWRKIEDAMPELPNIPVLVFSPTIWYAIGELDYGDMGDMVWKVMLERGEAVVDGEDTPTHWMPLPEPPEVDNG